MATGDVFTNSGLNLVIDRSFNGSPTRTVPSVFKVGIGTTTPSVGDTAIEKPVPFDGTETVDDCETDNWSDSTNTATALNATTYKQGSNSISIAKTGTASTTFGCYKTTTSINFTSKTLFVWVYLTDVTDLIASGTALTVRFGSDSSNYYYYNVAIGSLSNGWNLVYFSSATATGTTGSPSIAACDYSQIIFNVDNATDTVIANRVLMDDWKVASADDFTNSFETGYPSFDYTNNEVTIQGRVSATQANGYNISEFGVFNTDATALLVTHSVFTAVSKTSSDEIYFINTTTFKNTT